MKTNSLELFLTLARTQAILTRRFDNSLGGLGLTEFSILLQLSLAPQNRLCRLELADKIGLTASGITRVLLPMEKIGLISKEKHATDARISLVCLTRGGTQKLTETLERIDLLTSTLLGEIKEQNIPQLTDVLQKISRNAL